MEKKVRQLILIGDDADNIEQELGSTAQIQRAIDLTDAVGRGFKAALPGDVVLLAPACASFDMFRSFEHRGEVFKGAVTELANSQSKVVDSTGGH
jgi:UDP-N-acetylmuramoylalanine--D-glutamate ligase